MASTYAAVSWLAPRAPEPETQTQKLSGGLESVKTRMISVPVVADGAIHGYVMAQFVFTVDSKTMKHLSVKPDVFLLDEAFKAIYGGESVDFRQFKKRDLQGLSKQIGDNVNKRLGVAPRRGRAGPGAELRRQGPRARRNEALICAVSSGVVTHQGRGDSSPCVEGSAFDANEGGGWNATDLARQRRQRTARQQAS